MFEQRVNRCRWLYALARLLPGWLFLAGVAAAADVPAAAATCQGGAGRPAASDLARPEWISAGRQHFVQTCAYCHGPEGEAGKVRPFKSHVNWDPGEIFNTISEGRRRGGNVMPTWKDAIPAEEIWKIVAYIKSLSAPNEPLAADAAAPAAAALCADTPPAARTPTAAELAQAEWIDQGRAHFIQTCAYCHGPEGEAGKVRPFRSHTPWEPREIFETIANGRRRGSNVMPSWKEAIPAEEIWKIVAYIKSLSAGTTQHALE
mgnify:CR=1 FL=1